MRIETVYPLQENIRLGPPSCEFMTFCTPHSDILPNYRANGSPVPVCPHFPRVFQTCLRLKDYTLFNILG